MAASPSHNDPVSVTSATKPPRAFFLSADFLEALPDSVIVVEPDGTIAQVNSQTEELFGYQRGELLGQKVEMLIPERFRRQHPTHREDFTQSPRIRRMGAGLDLYGRRRDGSEFAVEISLSPVSTTEGTLVLSAIRDISEHRQVEEDLRKAHQELERRTSQQLGEFRGQLASIIDSSSDAIIGKTLDGTITSWNKGAEKLYGYTAEEMVGQNVSKLVPRDRPDELPTILQKVRLGENVEPFESVRVAKDGRHFTVSLSISPIRRGDGRVVGASAIARDMTAQKHTEEQLRQAQKMEAIGRLAGGVAHDFNNILAIITACAELLRDRIASDAELEEFIANMREAVERGRSLTRQLLAFNRRSTIQPQILDLNLRVKEVGKLLRPLMGDDVEIVIAPAPSAALVEVDPGQFDQIVLNLSVNSRDAMPKGGKFILEVSVTQVDQTVAELHPGMSPGRYVVLAVSDNGTGMDAATTSRVFEPFFTTKSSDKGTGLGLSTVYGIIKQSGGHVWVYSEVGRGTTFKIYLPSAEHKLGEKAEAIGEVESTASGSGICVLLVEDDPIMLRLTRKLLEQQGFEVTAVSDGDAALQAAAHQKVDLLLTDVVMRGMSGPELATRLAGQRDGFKVVFMSGYTGELMSASNLSRLEAPLVEKPFTKATLLRAIQDVLGR